MYLRFSYMMKGVCLRYSSNEADAEDLLQESFIKVFRNLESYQESSNLGAWMRKIALNCALEKYRNEKNKKQVILYVETYFENDFSFENQLATLEMEDLMKNIQALPLGYRTVFNLYAIEGFQHNEIAELLKISEGTSKSQYSRAKVLLKEMLEKDDNFHLKSVNYEK